MRQFWQRTDGVLRGDLGTAVVVRSEWHLFACVVLFGLFYGGVMGSYGGLDANRVLQIVYSGSKVPLLLLTTFALSLPSFFVLNTLLGVREDFAAAVRALIATQAGLTIILAALAPFTLFWYCSVKDYRAAVLFNGLMFGIASVSAQILLRKFYAPLILRDERHRWLLRCWLVVYSFVAIQLAWILRPFIGDPKIPPQFFRQDLVDNAYVIVIRLIWETLRQFLGFS